MSFLSRRRLLTSLLALAGSLLVSRLPGNASPRSPIERFLATIRTPRSLAALGQAYLEAHPEEADGAALAAHIEESLGSHSGGQALRRALAAPIRADFETGQVVSVRGWILSRTETRVAALAALRSRSILVA